MDHEEQIVAVLDRLTVTLNALITVVESLYETHPDPSALLQALLRHGEPDTARELATASDEALEAGAQIRQAFASLFAKRIRGG